MTSVPALVDMVYDELSRRIRYPLVSIPKMVSEEIVSAGITKVGLLKNP